MREKPTRIALWSVPILMSLVIYVYADLLPRPIGGPWLALSGILFLLASIALGARRHLPFGERV
jgi:hypothetical protein